MSRTEEEVYARLGLAWVPPAMREDRGEVQAAARGEIPTLVRENDLRGDLHTHTDLTDGVATLEDMVAAAERRGYAYYAITDHAPNLVMHRMTDEKMLAQRDRVRALEPRLELLHGTELNIAPDGSVDWPGDFLAGFDLCVASVHSHFDQPRAEMTRRFVDSDAHSVADLDNVPYGVGTAQRGWLTPDDVINTWPLDRLRAFLAKGR